MHNAQHRLTVVMFNLYAVNGHRKVEPPPDTEGTEASGKIKCPEVGTFMLLFMFPIPLLGWLVFVFDLASNFPNAYQLSAVDYFFFFNSSF